MVGRSFLAMLAVARLRHDYCASALRLARAQSRRSPRAQYRPSPVRMMPEGPECHALADTLHKRLGGGRYALEGVDVLSGRYATAPPANLAALSAKLPLTLSGVRCRGKFIYFALAGDVSLWSTLGMSGGWTLGDHRHARLALTFRGEGDDGPSRLSFYDARNFGTLTVCFEPGRLDEKLASLGLSWLEDGESPDFDEKFAAIVDASVRRTPAKPLAVFLMDQKRTSGIGNYLLSEILWATGTRWDAAIGDVSDARWAAIRDAALLLIRKSRDAQLGDDRGRPLRAMRDFRLAAYGRAADPDGHPVRRVTGPHGRTIHWVPERQVGPDEAEAAAAAAARADRDAAAPPSLAWTAARLRDACRARGLGVAGKKAELLGRLEGG